MCTTMALSCSKRLTIKLLFVSALTFDLILYGWAQSLFALVGSAAVKVYNCGSTGIFSKAFLKHFKMLTTLGFKILDNQNKRDSQTY